MRENRATEGGLGICGVLGVVFIVLKLCDVIAWSWWWVTAPFWIPFAIIIVVIVVAIIVSAIQALIDRRRRKYWRMQH